MLFLFCTTIFIIFITILIYSSTSNIKVKSRTRNTKVKCDNINSNSSEEVIDGDKGKIGDSDKSKVSDKSESTVIDDKINLISTGKTINPGNNKIELQLYTTGLVKELINIILSYQTKTSFLASDKDWSHLDHIINNNAISFTRHKLGKDYYARNIYTSQLTVDGQIATLDFEFNLSQNYSYQYPILNQQHHSILGLNHHRPTLGINQQHRHITNNIILDISANDLAHFKMFYKFNTLLSNLISDKKFTNINRILPDRSAEYLSSFYYINVLEIISLEAWMNGKYVEWYELPDSCDNHDNKIFLHIIVKKQSFDSVKSYQLTFKPIKFRLSISGLHIYSTGFNYSLDVAWI